MELIIKILWLLAGLVALVYGGDSLVKGASQLALHFGMKPLIIGLTIVSFGTSAPELAVIIQSGLRDAADIAIGNVVGSNIANVLLILGTCALVFPITIHQDLVRKEVPILIAISLAVYGICLDQKLVLWEGTVLFVGAIAYTVYAIRHSREEKVEVVDEYESEFGTKKPLIHSLFWLLLGIALLPTGAYFMVDSSVYLARYFGVSELITGLTIVAIGTSLPELATSLIASIKGENDIAAGNVVGSCIFNLLVVLGLGTIASPSGINVSSQALRLDLPVMIGTAVICYPIFRHGYVIKRYEGLFLLAGYTSYLGYLVYISL